MGVAWVYSLFCCFWQTVLNDKTKTKMRNDESCFHTKKVEAVSTSEHLFTFGKSKERKSSEGFVSPGWKNSERIMKNQGLYKLLNLEGKEFSQILPTYMVPDFSVLTFGESNKCPNGLTVFTSSMLYTAWLVIPNGCLDAYEVKVDIDIFQYQEKVKLISQFQRFFSFFNGLL